MAGRVLKCEEPNSTPVWPNAARGLLTVQGSAAPETSTIITEPWRIDGERHQRHTWCTPRKETRRLRRGREKRETRHELLTLLQKVTHRTQRSNSVFREAASRSFGGAGGFGGESDAWTESPVERRASILTRTCTEDGSTSTEEAKAHPGVEKFMTESISADVKDEVRRY